MCNIPRVLDLVVKNDLCTGCGLCVYKCPGKALEMTWSVHGFLVPKLTGHCDHNGDCLEVCPFNPYPKEVVKTEDELATSFLKTATQFHHKIGRYVGIYAGYSKEFRKSASSGGIATYVLVELLSRGVVNHIISVRESTHSDDHYEYATCHRKEDLLSSSKTKYFPVTLSTVLNEINSLDGKVAIVGVACFIKAIRLAQHIDPKLQEKITFLVGIICGGIKSRFFTEYLASKVGVSKEKIKIPQYRIKDYNSAASDYSFGCYDLANQEDRRIKMRTVGDMWGTGLFKANACDFCDDVTTELADISLGDAWLKPYIKDGSGTNVIVTRSYLSDNLIHMGVKEGFLKIENLSLDMFLESQRGSFNHRHMGLPFRIKQARRRKIIIPPKRFDKGKVTFAFKVVQKIRMDVRQKSLKIWEGTGNLHDFDLIMRRYLIKLKMATRLYHYNRLVQGLIRKCLK